MEVAPSLGVKDLPEHRSDCGSSLLTTLSLSKGGREPDSLSDGFVCLKRESGLCLFKEPPSDRAFRVLDPPPEADGRACLQAEKA